MWAGERVVDVFGLARGRKRTMASARSLTTDRIWRVLEKTAFAVISFVTPEGEPRSSGVVCAAARRHLYVVTASGSWKARGISDGDPVSVTVPVRRGGLLSLIAPIPCAAGLSAGRSNRRSGCRREEATLGVDGPGQVPVAVAVPYRQHLGAAGVRPADGVADLRPLVVPLGVGGRHVGATV
jgi:hypothetical protein